MTDQAEKEGYVWVIVSRSPKKTSSPSERRVEREDRGLYTQAKDAKRGRGFLRYLYV